jgi:hypothetical protein
VKRTALAREDVVGDLQIEVRIVLQELGRLEQRGQHRQEQEDACDGGREQPPCPPRIRVHDYVILVS